MNNLPVFATSVSLWTVFNFLGQPLANASMPIEPLPFACLDWDKMAASGTLTPYKTALVEISIKIRLQHPDLAASVGVGKCLNLAETSVLAIAQNHVLNFPAECMGLTFLGMSAQDMKDKAVLTVATQDPFIDGKIGSAKISVNGNTIAVPICMESFAGGGPQ